VLFGTDEARGRVVLWGMAKRRAMKSAKTSPAKKLSMKKLSKQRSAAKSPQQRAAATRKRNAAKRAKELAKHQTAEAAAATTIHYAPPPFVAIADPSKAPGHQHRHPPMSMPGVKHSEAYIAKARTPFNRRQTMGR
jgi:hypothetical protein